MGVKAIILFLPLAVLCALCGPVQAEDSAPVQDEPEPYDENLLRSSYYECMEKAGGKTPEEMKCIRLEIAYWEKRLDENFNRILKETDDRHRSHLLDCQNAWQVYRAALSLYASDNYRPDDAEEVGALAALKETARQALLLEKTDPQKTDGR